MMTTTTRKTRENPIRISRRTMTATGRDPTTTAAIMTSIMRRTEPTMISTGVCTGLFVAK